MWDVILFLFMIVLNRVCDLLLCEEVLAMDVEDNLNNNVNINLNNNVNSNNNNNNSRKHGNNNSNNNNNCIDFAAIINELLSIPVQQQSTINKSTS